MRVLVTSAEELVSCLGELLTARDRVARRASLARSPEFRGVERALVRATAAVVHATRSGPSPTPQDRLAQAAAALQEARRAIEPMLDRE